MRACISYLAVISFLFFNNQTIFSQECEALYTTLDGTDITIQFTDISTSQPGDTIVSWFRDFDDESSFTQ